VDRGIFREWEGDVYLFLHGLPVERAMTGLGGKCLTIPMQGTVSLVMLLLARIMGGDRLYLAGFDFAVDGLRDHHRGGGFESFIGGLASRTCPLHTLLCRRMRAAGPIRTRDASGRAVWTTPPLMLYRNWMEREVDLTGCLRVNRGAAVEGLQTYDEDRDFPGIAGASDSKEAFRAALKEAGKMPIERDCLLTDLTALRRTASARGLLPPGGDGPVSMRRIDRALSRLVTS
jgi:hypothetical protein